MDKGITLMKCTCFSKKAGKSESHGIKDSSLESLHSVIDQFMVSAITLKGENESVKIFIEFGTVGEMASQHDGNALFQAMERGDLQSEFTRKHLKERDEVLRDRNAPNSIHAGEVLTDEICGSNHSLENV
jgi:tRNA G10  N-methylase Trm11